jgi:hypothetical protein
MSTSQFWGGVVVLLASLLGACGGAVDASEETPSAQSDSEHFASEPTAADCQGTPPLELRGSPTRKSQTCSPEFTACRANKEGRTLCINGNCSCLPPIHPGENTPVSCPTGEPDMGLP